MCDPAVGSGHFLVSALNELLSIKSELKVLQDENGKTLRDYTLEVISDELVITDDATASCSPTTLKTPESQRVQKTLFLEKQTLIENCLFGVDLNPNSVKICRLRLWIELLKHAYYKEDGQLETLPNIDINIKTGNSLISRFALGADLGQALKKSGTTVKRYQDAVNTYRNATSKEEKREMERLIEAIKTSFRIEMLANDPKIIEQKRLRARLGVNQDNLFADTEAQTKEQQKEQAQIQKRLEVLDKEIKEVKNNRIFEGAFEWRFEFPEVLDDNGDFIGFDIILGNPPYIRQETIGSRAKEQLAQAYRTYHGSADLLVYFVELGVNLLRQRGQFSYIIANKWIRADYGKPLRKWLKGQQLLQIVDYGDLPVFEEATTYPCILSVEKAEPTEHEHDVQVVKMESLEDNLRDYAQTNGYTQSQAELDDNGWSLASEDTQKVLAKLNRVGVPLEQYVDGKIFYGIKTGLNDAFVIDEATKDKLIAEDPKSAEVIKPFLAGRDIKKYFAPKSKNFLVFAFRGFDLEAYPAIKKHLSQFKDRLTPKPKGWTGADWHGRKPGPYKWYEIQDTVAYYREFEKPKIIYPNICKKPEFTFDISGKYTNQKCFIIPVPDKYLLGLLNSSVTFFLFRAFLPKLRGDFYEPGYAYLKDFPIRTINPSDPDDQAMHDQMVALVERMLELHEAQAKEASEELALEIQATDEEIDGLVYGLYGLTEEEIGILEASVNK